MKTRSARQLLWTAASAAAGGAVLTITLAVAVPLNLPLDNPAAVPSALPSQISAVADDIPSLADLSQIASIDLGHDSVAAASPAGPAAPEEAPLPDIHIIGTILEPGH